MASKETGGSAFPWSRDRAARGDAPGMTLRDYFAAKAMQGLLSNPKLSEQIKKQGQGWIAESAYAWADDMLAERTYSTEEEYDEE